MLDKEVFKEQFEKILILYPNWRIDFNDAKTAKVWYEQFKHMDDVRFTQMISSYIQNEKFNPTVKGLLENDTAPQKSLTQVEHEKMLQEMGSFD
jgi:hypothetical protein